MRIHWIFYVFVAFSLALQPARVQAQEEDALDALLEGLEEGVGEEAAPSADSGDMQEPAAEPEDMENSTDDLLRDLGFGEDDGGDPVSDDENMAGEEMTEDAGVTGDALDDALDAAADEFDDEEMDNAETDEGVLEEVGNVETVDVEVVAKDMDAREVVKRRLLEIEGFKALDEGYKSLSDENWLEAIEQFEKALVKLPVRPANEEYIMRAKWGAAEANYKLAEIAFVNTPRGAPLDTANEFIEEAKRLVPDHSDTLDLEQKIEKLKEKEAKGALRPTHIKDTPAYRQRNQEIARLINEGKQLYEVNELDKAEDAFEGVIFLDRYNRDALRFLRKIADARYESAAQEFSYTQQRMAAEVRDAWNPPLGEQAVRRGTVTPQEEITTRTDQEIIEEQMSKIIIQELSFRQANIIDVVNFLVDTSRQQDPTGKGINIILNLQSKGGSGSSGGSGKSGGASDFGGDDLGGELDFDLGDFDDTLDTAPDLTVDEPAETGSKGISGVPSVTLNLRRVTLLDALKFVTDITRLKYRVENGVVVIKPINTVDNPITRFYSVDATLFQDFTQSAGGGVGNTGGGEFEEFGAELDAGVGGPPDVKQMFVGYGVPFPPGTSITYSPTLSQITVVNTPENIEKFERVISKLNVIPRQIEIEAKFVEILQDDLEELGLEWIFTDDWEIATREGNGPIAARERLVVGSTPFGVTKANRFFGQGSTDIIPSSVAGLPSVGDILSVSGVLTNPELQVVLHAINQSGNANLLSAPRITTLNGVNAQIEVVEEIIYPTEFEFDDRDIDVIPVFTDGQASATTVPPAVLPGSFETREVGVILNVTPQVNADNYTINLTLVPEIAELVDWLQYGATFPLGGGETFLVNIPQPLFASRNITTSIVVWDGHTVVMGGLIREDVVKFEDKIPILGDIPLLGRLFTSRGEKSSKRNLVIFVTARLVDPAGNPINDTRGVEPAVAEAGTTL